MIEQVEFGGELYPKFIACGNHARFIIPVAQEVCVGTGLDVGCGKLEWKFPGAIPIDSKLSPEHDALNLPDRAGGWDYIFSSHCLEHLPNYVEAVRHWQSKLRSGGALFLYLPHPKCKYWLPWNQPSKRHVHFFYPQTISDVMTSLGFKSVHVSDVDLAYSFSAYGFVP